MKDKAVNGNKIVERLTGLTAVLISFLFVAAIITDLDIFPEIDLIKEDLGYIGENLPRLKINVGLWLVNSVLIVFLGPLLIISFMHSGRALAYLGGFMITSNGFIYLLFAVSGMNLISLVNSYLLSTGQQTDFIAMMAYNSLIRKESLQLVAYTLSGLSSIFMGLLFIRTRNLPGFIGMLAISSGLIYASFGWINPESIIFTIGRMLFILSIILMGSYLLLKGTVSRTKKEV